MRAPLTPGQCCAYRMPAGLVREPWTGGRVLQLVNRARPRRWPVCAPGLTAPGHQVTRSWCSYLLPGHQVLVQLFGTWSAPRVCVCVDLVPRVCVQVAKITNTGPVALVRAPW